MTNGQLSYWDCQHIREILADPALLRVILVDGNESAKFISVDVDGSITLGRTRHKWLNFLFKDIKPVSFTDFAFKVANALAGQSNNRNEVLFQGIADVVLRKAIASNDKKYVVDAIYDTLRHGWDGESSSRFLKAPMAKDLPESKARHETEYRNVQYGEIRLPGSHEILVPRIIVESRYR